MVFLKKMAKSPGATFKELRNEVRYPENFRHGLRMELLHGILRGLGSLKEGESAQIRSKIDFQEFVQVPKQTKLMTPIEVDIEAQCLGEEYLLTVKGIGVMMQAPCSTCGHSLQRFVQVQPEHIAFHRQEVHSGEVDLKGYLHDLLLSIVTDYLSCELDPCEWREDVDRFLAKNAQQRENKAFHPFKTILSEKKWKMSQE